MDIDDVRANFGDRYDEEIARMVEYTDSLIRQGVIK